MQHRYTVMSVVVTGVLAFILVTPPDETVQKPQKPTEIALPKQQPAPMQMASVTLPPPPALERTTIKPITVTATVAPQKVIVRSPLKTETVPAPKATPIKAMAAPQILKPIVRPQPQKPEARQPAKQSPAPKSATEAKQQGRPLLKLLEFGKGPSIEIAWPDNASERARLYTLFSQCYGMRVALMSETGNLYDQQSPRGQASPFNTDKFSGFVRQSQGQSAAAEASEINAIKNHHGLRFGNAVRLFPRETDALLLGGLYHLIGTAYTNNPTIRATYQVSGWRVHVSEIHTGNGPISGTVDLSGAVKTRCRI